MRHGDEHRAKRALCEVLACGVACLAPLVAQATGGPLLHPLFSDHAVLQRERPIPVWGWTEPRAKVSVQLGTITAEAVANESGRWEATLPAMPGGGPHTLLARSGSAEQSARDILVGDVFLCSGQSNMALQVHRTLDSRAEIARATDDSIRMFTVPMEGSAVPLETVAPATRWLPASPRTVPDFSATCFYFARELKRHIAVPMGLLHASWGGSNISTWLSRAALEATGRYERELDILRSYPSDPAAANREWGGYWEQWYRSRLPSSAPLPWATRGSGGSWKPAPAALGHWESWDVPELAAYNGIVWYRTAVVLNAAQARSAATLSLGAIDEVDHTWVNGRFAGSESGADTPRVYKIAPGVLRAGENLIVIAALDTYATGGIHGPAEQRVLRFENGSPVPLDGSWQYQLPPEGLGSVPRAPWDPVSGLSVLHNAMIAPLAPFAVRGAVWYQGESNTDDAANYSMLLSALMKDWRGTFGSDLPFLVVQLANYGPPSTSPQESGWAEVREAQRLTVAADSRAALAVAVDIGDRYDIHPANKQELARRLARAARSVIYGEPLAPSGPVPQTARREREHIAITFRDVEGELVTYGSDRVVGFELCGAEPGTCSYSPGTVEGNTVRLPAPQDRAPARVRFCWADSPLCNLYDRSGLPAGPFEAGIR